MERTFDGMFLVIKLCSGYFLLNLPARCSVKIHMHILMFSEMIIFFSTTYIVLYKSISFVWFKSLIKSGIISFHLSIGPLTLSNSYSLTCIFSTNCRSLTHTA